MLYLLHVVLLVGDSDVLKTCRLTAPMLSNVPKCKKVIVFILEKITLLRSEVTVLLA